MNITLSRLKLSRTASAIIKCAQCIGLKVPPIIPILLKPCCIVILLHSNPACRLPHLGLVWQYLCQAFRADFQFGFVVVGLDTQSICASIRLAEQ
jgi:hypothetical protein